MVRGRLPLGRNSYISTWSDGLAKNVLVRNLGLATWTTFLEETSQ
jgi:hypothetical protein